MLKFYSIPFYSVHSLIPPSLFKSSGGSTINLGIIQWIWYYRDQRYGFCGFPKGVGRAGAHGRTCA